MLPPGAFWSWRVARMPIKLRMPFTYCLGAVVRFAEYLAILDVGSATLAPGGHVVCAQHR